MITFNAAGFVWCFYDASLVKAFRGDSIAIAKLNEEFYRSRIPAKTYDRLLLGVTNEDQLKALRNSFLLYTEELAQSRFVACTSCPRQARFTAIWSRAPSPSPRAPMPSIQELVETESRLLPTLDNRLRHTRVAELLSESETTTDHLAYVGRAHLFKGVSRIKNPDAHLIKFSEDQKRQVVDAMQPGDVILTYTAGYMSDIFIPGAFKHAITYVGSVKDRQDAGLSADRLTWVPDPERERLLQSVGTAKTASGEDADVIEAVAEGVIFNHLGHLMDTHINRLVVLPSSNR